MKKLAIVSSSFLLVLVVVSSEWAFSANGGDHYGIITKLRGHSFGIYQQKTFALRKGYQVPSGTELMTEEGGQVSFMDFHNREYHLSGSGHVTVTRHGVKLSRGYLWVRSLQRDQKLYIKSANSVAEVLSGEGIFSFNNTNGKSQILSIKGEFKFAHFLDVNQYEIVRPGEFSIIDPEMTSPRRSTPIGFSSYEKIIALFRKEGQRVLPSKRQNRSVASLPEFQAKDITHEQVKGLRRDLRKLSMRKRQKLKGYVRSLPRKEAPSPSRDNSKKNRVITRIFGLKKLPEKPEREESSFPSAPQSSLKTIKFEPKSVQKELLYQRKRWDVGAGLDRLPASKPSSSSSWGFKSSLKQYLKKTSRQKLLDDGLLEDLKDHRLDYKTSN